ncbi:50S ribosomal protein L17 [Candidatus Microgenomates bacterium]|nr:50S ribosomal protein L17 [Candidatus Microgenomates bacterium]
MRHRVYGYKLGRNKDERDRLFKSLISSLFLHGTIETSERKAKAIKGLVDKIINLAKDKTRKRFLQTYLVKKDLQERLIKDIIPKLGNKTSGYTSLVKLGTRVGDRTMVVRMGLIGVGEMKPIEKMTSDKGQVTSKKKENNVAKKPISEKKVRGGRSARSTESTRKGNLRSSKKRLSKTK